MITLHKPKTVLMKTSTQWFCFAILFAIIIYYGVTTNMVYQATSAEAVVVSTKQRIKVKKNNDFKTGDHALAVFHIINGKPDSLWQLTFPQGNVMRDYDTCFTTDADGSPFDSTTLTAVTLWERIVEVKY
jgi:hypothetical protein